MSASLVTGCTFDTDYRWSGFGGGSAYAISAMYLREPGQTDRLITLSQQADSPVGATARGGELLYQLVVGSLTPLNPSADARVVIRGLLFATKGRTTVEVVDARADSIFAIPASCLT